MPGFNGSGTFVRTYAWATDKTNTVPVTASRMDGEDDGFATGLTNTICRDGQSTTTARIPFASGLSAAAGSNSAAAFCQTNDANTGVYFPTTDEVALTAGGTKTLHSTATVVTIPTGVALKSNTTPYDAFPSGTALLFRQTSAPTGWTKETGHNDKALRIVSGSITAGGTVPFSTCFSRTTTDNFTIAQANLPNVSFTNSGIALTDNRTWATAASVVQVTNGGLAATGAGTAWGAGQASVTVSSGTASISAQGSAASGGSGTALNAGMDIRVQYTDVISATKD